MTPPNPKQEERVFNDPERIWLSPVCDSLSPDGRTWACPAPQAACDDCGEPWVEYVRADRIAANTLPEGWVMVPREATERMREAGWLMSRHHKPFCERVVSEDIWSAMIAASPPIDAVEGGG